jgi:hypothetical protein
MAAKLKIPKWSGLIQTDLEKIDLGARIKPITRSEAESGLLLRGPVVLAAVPQTSDGAKRQLPIIMTNVRLLDENNRFMVEYTGSPYRITEFHISPRIRPTIGGLLLRLENGEQVKLRKLLRGDLDMFRLGNGSGETEIRPFLEGFWDR